MNAGARPRARPRRGRAHWRRGSRLRALAQLPRPGQQRARLRARPARWRQSARRRARRRRSRAWRRGCRDLGSGRRRGWSWGFGGLRVERPLSTSSEGWNRCRPRPRDRQIPRQMPVQQIRLPTDHPLRDQVFRAVEQERRQGWSRSSIASASARIFARALKIALGLRLGQQCVVGRIGRSGNS